MNHAVIVEKLRKVYVVYKRSGWLRTRADVVSVDDVSFSVPEGQALAFIGPNGAGKSTTIRMLTGILHPTAGDARVLGHVPWKERSKLTAKIGAVFGQRSQLWYHLPAGDTFDLLAKIYNLKEADYRSQRKLLVDCFDLHKLLDVPVRKLSLGQRMRAEVAASLLHKPRLLLLDEPTIGLDIHARQQLRALIRKWNKEEGLTVFLTSHDTGDIESVAERVIVINHGRLVLDNTVSNLRKQYGGLSLEDAISHIYGLERDAQEAEKPSDSSEAIAS